jgi:hypothetical protein
MGGQQDARGTDAPYGPDETRRILAEVQDGEPGKCPRCGGQLEHGPPADPTSSLFTVVMVRCPTCRRAVFAGKHLQRPPQAP